MINTYFDSLTAMVTSPVCWIVLIITFIFAALHNGGFSPRSIVITCGELLLNLLAWSIVFYQGHSGWWLILRLLVGGYLVAITYLFMFGKAKTAGETAPTK